MYNLFTYRILRFQRFVKATPYPIFSRFGFVCQQFQLGQTMYIISRQSLETQSLSAIHLDSKYIVEDSHLYYGASLLAVEGNWQDQRRMFNPVP